ERRPEFSFHMARIFIDNELNVPVRYEAYTWPDNPKDQPPLIEEYTSLDFKFTVQFTDVDFDFNTPDYAFPPDYGEPEVSLADMKPVPHRPETLGRPAAQAAADKPLSGVIDPAHEAQAKLDKTSDYTCLVSHRERS